MSFQWCKVIFRKMWCIIPILRPNIVGTSPPSFFVILSCSLGNWKKRKNYPKIFENFRYFWAVRQGMDFHGLCKNTPLLLLGVLYDCEVWAQTDRSFYANAIVYRIILTPMSGLKSLTLWDRLRIYFWKIRSNRYVLRLIKL